MSVDGQSECSYVYLGFRCSGNTVMKKNKQRKRRNAIAKVGRPSKARSLALRAASFVAGACLGVGFEELVRWLWEFVRHLF